MKYEGSYLEKQNCRNLNSRSLLSIPTVVKNPNLGIVKLQNTNNVEYYAPKKEYIKLNDYSTVRKLQIPKSSSEIVEKAGFNYGKYTCEDKTPPSLNIGYSAIKIGKFKSKSKPFNIININNMTKTNLDNTGIEFTDNLMLNIKNAEQNFKNQQLLHRQDSINSYAQFFQQKRGGSRQNQKINNGSYMQSINILPGTGI